MRSSWGLFHACICICIYNIVQPFCRILPDWAVLLALAFGLIYFEDDRKEL